jgi:hypothetical protein
MAKTPGRWYWAGQAKPILMSNIWTNCRWFPVPVDLVDGGHLKSLSHAAESLYLYLLRMAQRHSAVELESPAHEIADYTDLHRETVTLARRELEAARLITSRPGAHGVTCYCLLHPETGETIPPPAGRKGIRRYQPNGRTARSAAAAKRVLNATIGASKIRHNPNPGVRKVRHAVSEKSDTPISQLDRSSITSKDNRSLNTYLNKKGISEQDSWEQLFGEKRARDER